MVKTVEARKMDVEIGRLRAETTRLNAEIVKMIHERAWYPVFAIAIAMVLGAAIAKLLL